MTDYALSKGIGGHHRPNRGRTDEWLTPPPIITALGEFDLDPCSPVDRPWDTAKTHFTIEDDGLLREWNGRVWLNTPYGPEVIKWMGRMAEHNHGTALIFARTETDAFHRYVWNRASAVLFLRGRLNFYSVKGERAKQNAGAPSCLIAYGQEDAIKLASSGIKGKFILIGGNAK